MIRFEFIASGFSWRSALLLLAAGMILAAPPAGYFGLQRFLRERAPTRWPHTTGTITAVELIASTQHESQQFFPRVYYRFEVQGESYQGWRIKNGATPVQSEAAATAILANYPIHARHEVYYDPNDPRNNALSVEMSPTAWAWLILPMVLGLSGAVLLRVWFEMRKADREREIPSDLDI